jgi:hypothetical protein
MSRYRYKKGKQRYNLSRYWQASYTSIHWYLYGRLLVLIRQLRSRQRSPFLVHYGNFRQIALFGLPLTARPPRGVLELVSPSTSSEVVDEPDGRQEETESEDADVDGKASSVTRLVVLSEDLSSIDTSNIGAHDDPDQTLCSAACLS